MKPSMINPPKLQPGDKVAVLTLSWGGVGKNPPEKFIEYNQILWEVVRDEVVFDKIPILTNMDFGHTDPMMTLSMGFRLKLIVISSSLES